MVKTLLVILIGFMSIGLTQAQSESGCEDCPDVSKIAVNAVYPNPAEDFIKVNASEDATNFTIYNVVGRKIKVFEIDKKQSYYIGDLPKGLYLVQITTKNNEVLTTQRLNKR